MQKTNCMKDFKNLTGKEGIEKLQHLIKSQNICLFATNLNEQPLSIRPMGTQDVDDDGRIWFLSRKDSEKNLDIEHNDRVQLFYSNISSSEYLSIYGEAEIYTDRDKIEDHWSPIAKAWFKDGKKDSDVSLIAVIPLDAYYWDTKNNRMITLVKIMAGAVSGHSYDLGVEGKINL